MKNMKRLLVAGLAILVLGFTSTTQAQTYSTSASDSADSGNRTYTVSGNAILVGYSEPHQLRVVITMEFETGNGDGTYDPCPYWPESYCSWSTDTGDVLAYELSTSLTEIGRPMIGRFKTWVDYYLDDSLANTIAISLDWPVGRASFVNREMAHDRTNRLRSISATTNAFFGRSIVAMPHEITVRIVSLDNSFSRGLASDHDPEPSRDAAQIFLVGILRDSAGSEDAGDVRVLHVEAHSDPTLHTLLDADVGQIALGARVDAVAGVRKA